jgi:molybdopterin/thiamine biosynthesis adenylyltransferase
VSATEPDPSAFWHARQPERLEWELEQFEARELPAEPKMGLRDGRVPDRLVIETELPFRGAMVPVEVAYPYEYPDDGPTLFGPPGLLDRHQQPRAGNFCWAEDSERDWWPGMDAAQLVAEDLRWLLEDTEKGSEAVRLGEADMPEPITGHIAYGDGAVVVPDPYFAKDLPASEGTMTLVGEASRYLLAHAANLGAADAGLRERYFKGKAEHDGFWVALDPTPTAAVFDGVELLNVVTAAAPRCFERLARRLKKSQSLAAAECWLGVTFIEEGPRRGEYRRNWAFARIALDRSARQRMYPKLRAQALTLDERQRRTPELVGIGSARVLLVGAGSLGSPLCCELVKAGVGHTDVVDPDTFDVNNSVRHVVSPHWAGASKAAMTVIFAQELNPFVTVESHSFFVGGGADAAGLLNTLLAQASVVVDTTGANSVARILQRRCAEAGKTLVIAGLSAGSYGGEVGVFRPREACFECMVLAQRDEEVPEPPAAPPGSGVTPVNCSHPAFAGAGFDATELAALTARTVVQATSATTYPALDFDWAVVNFRGEPRWQSGWLAKHPECERCS